MAVLIKIGTTLRNNWKKSVVGVAALAYGANYLRKRQKCDEIRTSYCQIAKQYGAQPLLPQLRARRVTVFLNPAARSGKALSLFQTNMAPYLHLAGLEVHVVKTERAGEAQDYMGVLDDTDAIVIAGGDGTVREVVTGILRREDYHKIGHIPIGVLPLGTKNSFAKKLFGDDENEVRWMAEASLAIIEGDMRQVDVMRIKGAEKDKPVYALSNIRYGSLNEVELKKETLWYLGPLRGVYAGLRSLWKGIPTNVGFDYGVKEETDAEWYLQYKPVPTAPASTQKRWWSAFIPKAKMRNVSESTSAIDYEKITSEARSEPPSVEAVTSFLLLSCNDDKDRKFLRLKLREPFTKWTRFVQYCSQRASLLPVASTNDTEITEFSLQPRLDENTATCSLYIDNEEFEVMPICVHLLPRRLTVFVPRPRESGSP